MTSSTIREVRLDNGFRALLAPRTTLPVVASVLWYQVGSRDERTGETGVSHFLEHMMFKGTDRFAKGQIDLLTSKMGGSNNAFTDNDGTAYYFALAADRWEAALEIEQSRMRGCLLDPHEFASEKSVVLEELAMGEDDPWRPLYQATESLLYQVHPYHHPVIGYRQDLERLGVDAMRGYYERHYGPNRSFLVVAGDIDVERTTARIEELFGSMSAGAGARADVLVEPPPSGQRRAVLRTPHAVSRLCIGFPTCRAGERDDYALDVVAHELGIGKTSRLYRRLVLDSEMVTEISVVNETRREPGALFVLAEVREGVDPAAVERVVFEEIQRLVDDGIQKSSLARILAMIRSSFMFQDESVLDYALKLARFEALTPDGYKTLDNVLPTYASLKSAELQRIAANYLTPHRAVCVHAVPAAATVAESGAGGKGDKSGKKKRKAPRDDTGGKRRRGKARVVAKANEGGKRGKRGKRGKGGK